VTSHEIEAYESLPLIRTAGLRAPWPNMPYIAKDFMRNHMATSNRYRSHHQKNTAKHTPGLLALAAVGAFLLTSCNSNDGADEAGPPENPIAQAEIAFQSSHRQSEILDVMDRAASATGLPLTDESYSRMGSVAVEYRKQYGVDEMELLECVPRKQLTNPKEATPQDAFVRWAASCAVTP
jgi:hypothetical protein